MGSAPPSSKLDGSPLPRLVGPWLRLEARAGPTAALRSGYAKPDLASSLRWRWASLGPKAPSAEPGLSPPPTPASWRGSPSVRAKVLGAAGCTSPPVTGPWPVTPYGAPLRAGSSFSSPIGSIQDILYYRNVSREGSRDRRAVLRPSWIGTSPDPPSTRVRGREQICSRLIILFSALRCSVKASPVPGLFCPALLDPFSEL